MTNPYAVKVRAADLEQREKKESITGKVSRKEGCKSA